MPPAQITGYGNEVEACARAIAQGEKECRKCLMMRLCV